MPSSTASAASGVLPLPILAPIISLDEQPTTTNPPRGTFAVSSSSRIADAACSLISSYMKSASFSVNIFYHRI